MPSATPRRLSSRSAWLCGAALALAVLLPGRVASAQFQAWRVSDGRLDLHFFQAGLAGSQLALVDIVETGPAAGALPGTSESPSLSLAVDASSDLLFLVDADGAFVPYGLLGGRAQVLGGFALQSRVTGQKVSLQDAVLGPVPVRNDGPGGLPDPDYIFMGSADGDGGQQLVVRAAKMHFDAFGAPYAETPGDHVMPRFTLMAWDFWITPELAERLGQPELAGQILGSGELVARAELFEGPWAYPPGQNPWTPYTSGGDGSDAASTAPAAPGDGGGVDILLGTLTGINSLIHEGTFPNGRNSFSMSTTSCNVGTVVVPWQAPMSENHPGIAMALYRELGDRFEQVGVSWMKHGFFSTNTSVCDPCQGGTGSTLGLGCSDTYGTSNNADPRYLGPRSEWNAFTAEWTCLGSFFDGTPVDCVRSETGSSFLGKVDHRLEAFDWDLGLPGATYFYEAMYLVEGDVNLHNNVGSRGCNLSWGFNKWTVSTTAGSSLVLGPAIERWGDLRTTAGLAPHDGNVILAVKTIDLGAGQWRYEYALFNWNLDRKLRSFSVPTGGGAVSDFHFHDIDNLPANDWVPSVAGGNLTWTFSDVEIPGVKVAGALEFGTLYNFGFTSTLPPGPRDARLGPHEDGPGGLQFGAATLAPAGLNLTSSALSPEVGVPFDLSMSGGSGQMLVAVLAVDGMPLPSPVLIGPLPFVGGQASVSLAVPAEAAGVEVLLVGGDVSTSPITLIGLANTLSLTVQ